MSSDKYLKGKECLDKGKAKKAEKILLKAAESGDQEAQALLGTIYRTGNGVPKDEQSAFHWFKEAAGHGNTAGLRGLGDCYAKGIGVEINEAEAVRCYNRASEYSDQESREKLLEIVNRFVDRIISKPETGQNTDPADNLSEKNTDYLKERAAYWLKRTAREGLADAQVKLGKCLENGLCMERNLEQAAYWYDRAASQSEEAAKRFADLQETYGFPPDFSKDAKALYERGSHHMEDDGGLILMDSYERGAFLIERAAELGYPEAQYKLGQLYMIGRGVDKSAYKGAQWYEKAAEQGFGDAQVALGGCYSRGTGVDNDPAKSVYWYEKAAEQGNPAGEYFYGAALYNGDIVEKDDARAFRLFMKSAEKDNANGQIGLGACYANGRGTEQDKEKAFHWYELAARQNNRNAMYLLGCAWMDKEEYEKATYWLRKAEEKGEIHASYQLGHAWFMSDENRKHAIEQYDLGCAYLNGDGKEQDDEKAVQCLKQAAELYHTDAQYLLGFCYEEGRGVEKDDSKAAYWYEEAAKPRDKYLLYADKYKKYTGKSSGSEEYKTDAWMKTGEFYKEGKGVKKNLVKAAYWLEQAAAGEDEDALRLLEEIRPQIWDLSKEVVETIYEDCLADEAYTELTGCESVDLPEWELLAYPSETIVFDPDKIKVYSLYIDCLLGQLRAIHKNSIFPVSFHYTDDLDYLYNLWSDDPQVVRELFALGIANDSISRFYPLENGTYVARTNPTAIPISHTTNPRFQEWFEKVYKTKCKKNPFFNLYDMEVVTALSNFKLPLNLLDQSGFLFSYFWFQPSDSREKLITVSKEAVIASDHLTEEERKVYYKKISSYASIADKQDLLLYRFNTEQDDEHVIYNYCYQYDPSLQEKAAELLQQGEKKEKIVAELILSVCEKHSEAMFEIMKKTRSGPEEEGQE